MKKETKEKQYGMVFDVAEKHGITRLGLMINESWNQDPKRTLFTLARYKFVAKMLAGAGHVLEVGCADAFGTRLIQQAVAKVTAVDFDPVFIRDAKDRHDPAWPMESQVYASPQSKAGHVNCKSGPVLKALFQRYFHNVFLFSMNDEVVHTGFASMAHYVLVLCCGKKDGES
jgi:SAM-dependent methyltransferase